MKRMIIGIIGASGIICGVRALETLVEACMADVHPGTPWTRNG
jgi:3-polyprenyl-4-hydroxybenzoate decarboxylase